MSFNEILEECGEFGLYQKLFSFGYLALSVFSLSFLIWTQIFILILPSHHCKTSPEETEWMPLPNSSFPNLEVQRCHISEENGTTIPCPYGVIYDFSMNFPTFSSEQDWVCSASWKMYLVHTCYWLGATIGPIVFGLISDQYGRKRSYMMSAMLALISDIATFFCPEQISFTIARFFSGAGQGSLSTLSFTLVMEYTGPNKRRIILLIYTLAYTTAAAVIPWVAYYVRYWKYILIASYMPLGAALLTSFWIPESACWLLTKGRIDEAVQNIRRMAKVNGKALDPNYILSKLQEDKNLKRNNNADNGNAITSVTEEVHASADEEMTFVGTALSILNYPNLLKKIAGFMLIWLIIAACYNGNNLETSHLPFNMYIIHSIAAVSELPVSILIMFILDKTGRRWITTGLLLVGGISGILGANIEDRGFIFAFALFVRACYSSAYDVILVFSSESFPTVIRGTAQNLVKTFGGIGSILAPLIVNLAEKEPLLPYLVFGIMAVTAGILTLLMPETAKQHLPHTLEEGESFGKDQPFLFCPFTQKIHQEDSIDPKRCVPFGKIRDERNDSERRNWFQLGRDNLAADVNEGTQGVFTLIPNETETKL